MTRQWKETLNEPIKCLKDRPNGAQISIKKEKLIDELNLAGVGRPTITSRGIIGQPVIAQLVKLNIEPYPDEGCENIASYRSVFCGMQNVNRCGRDFM